MGARRVPTVCCTQEGESQKMRPHKRLSAKAFNRLNLLSILGGNPRAVLPIGFRMSPCSASLNDRTTPAYLSVATAGTYPNI